MKQLIILIGVAALIMSTASPALSRPHRCGQQHNGPCSQNHYQRCGRQHLNPCNRNCLGQNQRFQRPRYNNNLGVPIRWVEPVGISGNAYGYGNGYGYGYRDRYGNRYNPYGNRRYYRNQYRRGRCR